MGLETYRRRVNGILKGKTPNVTLLQAAKKIIEAADKWRSCRPESDVARSIMESVFFLLAACNQIGNFNLDKMLKEICEEKKACDFNELPDDLVWSFIIYESKPHTPYRSPQRPLEFKP